MLDFMDYINKRFYMDKLRSYYLNEDQCRYADDLLSNFSGISEVEFNQYVCNNSVRTELPRKLRSKVESLIIEFLQYEASSRIR